MVTRIRQLLAEKQLTPTQFADLIGVGRPVVSHILSERNKPSLEVVQRVVEAFPEIALPWLLRGTGPMLAEEASPPATPPQNVEEPAAAEAVVALTPPVEAPSAIPTPASGVDSGGQAAPQVTSAKPSPALAATAPLVAPRPFSATRFVPGVAKQLPSNAPVSAPKQGEEEPVPTTPASVSPTQATATPALPLSKLGIASPHTPPAATQLPLLAEPGKAIRRIVIFYRDGSFADYQPEA